MALNLEAKKQIVSDISALAEQAQSVIAADYRGLNVAQMTDLRTQAREQGVYLRVVKNTLARRALDKTPYQCVVDHLTGPLVLAFGQADPVSAAKLLQTFMSKHDQVEVKALAVEGETLEVSELKRLASLPTKEESIALLLGVVKAPVSQLAGTLSAIPAKLVRVLAAVQEQKQATAS